MTIHKGTVNVIAHLEGACVQMRAISKEIALYLSNIDYDNQENCVPGGSVRK